MTTTGSSTAVDLSRLPAPTIVEQLSYEAILAEMLADLVARDETFTALVESDPAMKVLEACAYRELLLRQAVNDSGRGVMLAFAQGSNLEHLSALFEVGRLVLDPGDPEAGVDPTLESDADLLQRTQLAPEGFSVAGPAGAYKFHALSAAPDVLDASADTPSPGEVLVTVLSRTGDGEADSDLIDAVDAALSAETVRPLTDHVTVQSATIIEYEIEAEIWTYDGPDPGVVLADATARCTAYRSDNHRLGRDIARSGIFAALHTAGVQRVNLIQPAADVVIAGDEASWCTSAAITHAGVDE